MGIEIIKVDELPKEIVENLEQITQPKYGYLFFGKQVVKFEEPPILLAQEILSKWKELLKSITEKIVREIVETYDRERNVRERLLSAIEGIDIEPNEKSRIIQNILLEREKYIVDQLVKLGVNPTSLNDALIRMYADEVGGEIKDIIKTTLIKEGLSEDMVGGLLSQMTPNQMIVNLYSIISLTMYGVPFHELVKQQKELINKLMEQAQQQGKESKTESEGKNNFLMQKQLGNT